jgi:glucose-1-phosphate cytidylyltransferase
MIEIGGKPILWHILKIYSTYGINDFVICCGYKGYVIKEYFANYFLHMSDVTFDMSNNTMEVHHKKAEPWKITLVDTGLDVMTGGRLRRVREYIEDGTFCMTYGDGLCDVNVRKVIEFHQQEKRLATVTAIQPSGRFGALNIEEDQVLDFKEKPKGDGTWINGGFFVLEPAVMDLIEDDSTIWERYPLEKLTQERQLSAYRHEGYWAAMDTLREKIKLEQLWNQNKAPWKVWP